MINYTFRIASVLAAVAVIGASQAQVFSQISDNNGANSSQNDTNGLGNFATMYDNFTLGADTTITSVEWIGSYFNGAPAPITAWTVSIYGDAAGQPGALLSSTNVAGDAGETALGIDNAGDPEFAYNMGLNFDADAGTQYWLSVVPDLGFPPQWGWETSGAGDLSSYQDFFGARTQIGSDMSFALFGRGRVLTPEPFTMSLGIAGIGLFVRRRKAQKS